MDDFDVLAVPPAMLGESPLWHAVQDVLYWVDIAGRAVHCHDPHTQVHRCWAVDSEPASLAPLMDGALLLAARDGLWRFDPADGTRERVAEPPYDPGRQRFNDGKADPQGRFWVGTIDDARTPQARLYCLDDGRLEPRVTGLTVSNGLAFSPDGATMYWADTRAHAIDAFDYNGADGSLSRRRAWQRFAPWASEQPLADAQRRAPQAYGGRPDGAAMDTEGALWVAMFEGRRLLRLAPDGQVLRDIPLPVQCPTMPCFGGRDLKTLYLTTARDGRGAAELSRDNLAGCVLTLRVGVAGLPAHWARL